MAPWKVLIVDDEALARSNLQLALADLADWQVVGLCASAAEARVAMVQQTPDLVLLDIQMPRQHGLSFAAELAALPQPPLVVFVTAHDEHALAAFEVHAIDYLLKPVDDERLSQALARAAALLGRAQQGDYAQGLGALVQERQALANQQHIPALNQLVVRSVGQIERVAVSELRWLASAGNYVQLHLPGRRLLHRATLSALEERLPPGEFLRVHRTALVRPGELQSLAVVGDGVYEATLRGGDTVPVSERHVGAVRALFEGRT
ncbi:DNA-binding LytR/AlgR family response regulator [Inhella inkyongensis]|uniref:DNA-binding LytR/AlgR family response regulator n=1 Tax=Inhella inkyongensis TaxID=392593 RepID=A0A840S085_9BURK|nr:LytTR family DNA-binding domain-containing protein [Inhella inkyongensis]MBB5203203.1 DNA-binding LytR/AlgR family response regulator [Inhella inkyongensis]